MGLFASFVGWFNKGGPVMWPILFASVYGTTITVERWLFYRAQDAHLSQRWKEVEGLLDYDPAKNQTELSDEFLADKVTKAILSSENLDEQHRTEKLQVAFADEAAEIEKRLNVVSVIGTLLPMLGLLGTIGGMISAFNGIAEHGAGDPKYVADGIAKALVATASGLITAIPLIFLHQLLSNMADALTRRLDEFATHMAHICPKGKK
jgi:biopolymer transport protein ExbB